MSIEAISGIQSLPLSLVSDKAQSIDSSFSGVLEKVGQLDATIKNAELKAQSLATGDIDNLHQVMGTINKAKLNFDLAIQVRNKLLEGYQEIMRMQV